MTNKLHKNVNLVTLLLFIFFSSCFQSYHVVLGKQNERQLSISEISSLRVREIKRLLAIDHGYSASEISKMIDKRELINTLAFEEHKIYLKFQQKRKRERYQIGIIVSLIAVVVVMCWPLFRNLWVTFCVNIEVYVDRKKYEISRCLQFRSIKGCIGMFVLIILDLLNFWLLLSVTSSWIIPSNSSYRRFFFPTPYVPIQPLSLLSAMNQNKTQSSLQNYGVNVGPMFITFMLRFLRSRVESWIGRVLSYSHHHYRKTKTKKSKKKKKEQIKKKTDILQSKISLMEPQRKHENETECNQVTDNSVTEPISNSNFNLEKSMQDNISFYSLD